MKFYYRILFIITLAITTNACKQVPEEETPITIPLDTVVAAPAFNMESQSASFRTLVKTDSAIMRGISWKSMLKDVTDLEDAKTLVEQEEDYVDYLITLDSKEQADVLYYFNEASQIQKIELNIYPADEIAREKFYKEFITFFNAKYGLPTSEIAEVKIWKDTATNTYIEMRMLGNSKIHDLQIDIKNLSVNENF